MIRSLMDRVKEKREKIVITKRGKPVAQLVPIDEEEPESLFGYHMAWCPARQILSILLM